MHKTSYGTQPTMATDFIQILVLCLPDLASRINDNEILEGRRRKCAEVAAYRMVAGITRYAWRRLQEVLKYSQAHDPSLTACGFHWNISAGMTYSGVSIMLRGLGLCIYILSIESTPHSLGVIAYLQAVAQISPIVLCICRYVDVTCSELLVEHTRSLSYSLI